MLVSLWKYLTICPESLRPKQISLGICPSLQVPAHAVFHTFETQRAKFSRLLLSFCWVFFANKWTSTCSRFKLFRFILRTISIDMVSSRLYSCHWNGMTDYIKNSFWVCQTSFFFLIFPYFVSIARRLRIMNNEHRSCFLLLFYSHWLLPIILLFTLQYTTQVSWIFFVWKIPNSSLQNK